MNFLLSLLMILLWMVAPATAADVVLNWNANPESDLAGYKIYQSTISGQYGSPVATLGKVTTTTLVLPQLTVDAAYFFVITAYDLSGNESGMSAEVSKTVLADVPVPVNLTLALRGDPTSGAWAVEGATTATAPYAMEVWVNGALDHVERVAPFCSWGDNGALCQLGLRPAGSYLIEFRLIKNAAEIARETITVVVPDLVAPASPQGLTAQ